MKKIATHLFFAALFTAICTNAIFGMEKEKRILTKKETSSLFHGLYKDLTNRLTSEISTFNLNTIIGNIEKKSLINLHKDRILCYLKCKQNLKYNIIKDVMVATYHEKNKKISKIINLRNGEEFESVESHIKKKKYADQTLLKYKYNDNFLCLLISTRLYNTNRLKKVILIDLNANEKVRTYRNTSDFKLFTNHLLLNRYNSTLKLISLDNLETNEFNKVDSYELLGKEQYLKINYYSSKPSELVSIKKNAVLGFFSGKNNPVHFKISYKEKKYNLKGKFDVFLDYDGNKLQEKVNNLVYRTYKKYMG